MKKNILLILLLIYFPIFPQSSRDFNQKTNLVKPSIISEELQFKILIKKIMNEYGKSFKYLNELQNGYFKFNIKNGSGYYLNILNANNEIIESIKLYKDLYKNLPFLNYKKNEIEKLVNPYIYDKIKVDKQSPLLFEPENLIIRDSIIKDQVIIPIPEYHDFKVLNRSFATQHFIDQDQQKSTLYGLLEDAKIIPYWNGNDYSPKVLSVDAYKCSIIYGDQNVDIYSGNYVSDYYCTLGGGSSQLAYPTGIALGKEYTSGNNTIYPIYITDMENDRVVKANFVVPNEGIGYFDESSFTVVSHKLFMPYDIEYFL